MNDCLYSTPVPCISCLSIPISVLLPPFRKANDAGDVCRDSVWWPGPEPLDLCSCYRLCHPPADGVLPHRQPAGRAVGSEGHHQGECVCRYEREREISSNAKASVSLPVIVCVVCLFVRHWKSVWDQPKGHCTLRTQVCVTSRLFYMSFVCLCESSICECITVMYGWAVAHRVGFFCYVWLPRSKQQCTHVYEHWASLTACQRVADLCFLTRVTLCVFLWL